jgi:hypothetical protein
MADEELRGEELLREAKKTFGMDAEAEVTETRKGPPESGETTGTPPPETETKIESEEDLFRAAERARGQ